VAGGVSGGTRSSRTGAVQLREIGMVSSRALALGSELQVNCRLRQLALYIMKLLDSLIALLYECAGMHDGHLGTDMSGFSCMQILSSHVFYRCA